MYERMYFMTGTRIFATQILGPEVVLVTNDEEKRFYVLPLMTLLI